MKLYVQNNHKQGKCCTKNHTLLRTTDSKQLNSLWANICQSMDEIKTSASD